MKLKPLEKKILAAAVGVEQLYTVTIQDQHWDFWDPRVQFYLQYILENPTNLVEIHPMENEDIGVFTVFKFAVSYN